MTKSSRYSENTLPKYRFLQFLPFQKSAARTRFGSNACCLDHSSFVQTPTHRHYECQSFSRLGRSLGNLLKKCEGLCHLLLKYRKKGPENPSVANEKDCLINHRPSSLRKKVCTAQFRGYACLLAGTFASFYK